MTEAREVPVLLGAEDETGAQPQAALTPGDTVTGEVRALRPDGAPEDEALSTLMAMVSHELRAPVQALGINVALCLDRLRGPTTPSREWMQEKLHRQRRAVSRLRHLIDTFLDVAQITSGELELDLETVDLRELAQQVLRQVSDDLAWARCPCTLHPGGPVVGRWDRMQLDLVLTNLVSNAIKFGASRPVEVEIWGTEELGGVRVSDHGVGIAAEDQQRIFEKFVRLPSSTPGLGGLGLGLWVVRHIVETMGGTVRVTSVLGEGSAFTVTLPR